MSKNHAFFASAIFSIHALAYLWFRRPGSCCGTGLLHALWSRLFCFPVFYFSGRMFDLPDEFSNSSFFAAALALSYASFSSFAFISVDASSLPVRFLVGVWLFPRSGLVLASSLLAFGLLSPLSFALDVFGG